MGVRYTRRTLARELALILVAVVFCLPFYLLVAIALETTAQTYKTPLSFPWPPHVGQLLAGVEHGRAGRAQPRAREQPDHHGLERRLPDRRRLALRLRDRAPPRPVSAPRSTSLFVLGIILPFQLAIIPLYVAMRHLGLVGNYLGMIVLNVGLLMPLTVFLYTGFIRALPRDYEEAARVDGAGILRTYAQGRLPAAPADHRHGRGAHRRSSSGTSSSSP